jgi:two-component system phosphate regulon response regulator PhoB
VSHAITLNDKTIELGPTEFRLLHFFLAHPDRVYTRAQLLDQVWGDHVFIEERTVDVHIRRLRVALGAGGAGGAGGGRGDDGEDIIKTVRGSGYKLSAGRAHSGAHSDAH